MELYGIYYDATFNVTKSNLIVFGKYDKIDSSFITWLCLVKN